jgi:hypothetical protein
MAKQLLSSQDQRVLCTVTHCPATSCHNFVLFLFFLCNIILLDFCSHMTCFCSYLFYFMIWVGN